MDKSARYYIKNLQPIIVSEQDKWERFGAESRHLKHFEVAGVGTPSHLVMPPDLVRDQLLRPVNHVKVLVVVDANKHLVR